MSNDALKAVNSTINIMNKGWVLTGLDDSNSQLPQIYLYLNSQHCPLFAAKCDLKQFLNTIASNDKRNLTKDNWVTHLDNFTNDLKNDTAELTVSEMSQVGIHLLTGYLMNTKAGEAALKVLLEDALSLSLHVISYEKASNNILRPFVTSHDDILTPEDALHITQDIIQQDLNRNTSFYS